MERDWSDWDLTMNRAFAEQDWFLDGDGTHVEISDVVGNMLFRTIRLPGWRERVENYLIDHGEA